MESVYLLCFIYQVNILIYMWLIIGGSGFIGTNFAKFLTENDYNFKIYDQRRSKYLPKNVKTIVGDIRDKIKLSKAMRDCEIVFHLTTVPPSSRLLVNEIYNIDVNGTRNVLASAEKNNVKKVIFTSSASHVYGEVDKGLCPIREDCKPNPINEYGRNKIIAEELCKRVAESTKIKIIVLRLSMVIGLYNFDPILLENVTTLMKNKRIIIAGDGRSKNQSIHAKDVNNVLLASAEIPDTKLPNYTLLNISGKEALTINEWIELTRSVIDSKSKVTHLPLFLAKGFVKIAWWFHKTNIHPSYLQLMSQDQYFDVNKANRILDWEPKCRVKEALKDAVEFLKKEYS